MKSNQSAICLKRERENTTCIESNPPKKKLTGQGLDLYVSTWKPGVPTTQTSGDSRDGESHHQAARQPQSRAGLGSLLKNSGRGAGCWVWVLGTGCCRLALPPAPFPPWPPVLFPVGPSSKECGWRPRRGFEGGLRSLRVTPQLSETPCTLASWLRFNDAHPHITSTLSASPTPKHLNPAASGTPRDPDLEQLREAGFLGRV